MKRLILTIQALVLMGFLSGCGSDDNGSSPGSGSDDIGAPNQSHTGWAVGSSADGYGTIIHTTDSGKTWIREGNSTTIPDVDFNDVAAVDRLNVWVVGASSPGTNGTSYGTILRTTDGGETWIRQGSPSTIPDVELFGISSTDGEVAWVVGSDGIVLNTIDGGDTWVRQAQGLLPDADFLSVSAHDRNNVWAVGQTNNNTTACIIHTTDGGKTWVREGEGDIPLDSTRYYGLIDIHAFNKSTAWAVGSRGSVFITTDGGNSWVNKSWWDDRACCSAGGTDYNGVVVVSDLIAWKALDPAGVCLTTDGGDSWKLQEREPSYASGYYLYGITAIDENTVWVVGGNPMGDPGMILYTTDEGKTPWQVQINPVKASLRRVSFVGDVK